MIEQKLKAKDRVGEYINVVFLSDALEAHSKLIEEEYMESERWRSVEEELPHPDDGLVVVRMRNKNKEDGIFLYDIGYIDEETNTWSKRFHTWEKITHWKPIN